MEGGGGSTLLTRGLPLYPYFVSRFLFGTGLGH